MIFLPERIPLFEGPNRGPLLHTLRSDGSYLTAASLALDTKGIAPTFARNCVAYRDYWDGATRKLVEVPANVPRWVTRKDGSGTARSGLLVETQSTNICKYGSAINSWAIDSGHGSLSTAVASPFPSVNAYGVVQVDITDYFRFNAVALGVKETVGSIYIYSVFAKAGVDGWIIVHNAAPHATTWFDLANGIVGNKTEAVVSAGMESWGNGWWRVWEKFIGVDAVPELYLYSSTGNGVANIVGQNGQVGTYFCGAQLALANDFPSSPIDVPSTSDVTRLKDDLFYDVTGRIGQRGSLVFDVLFPAQDLAANVVPVSLHDGTANNRITCSILATGDKASATVVSGGDTQADITDATTDVVNGDKHTIAISWEPNSIKLYVDGTLKGTADTEATIPSGITTLTLGDHDGANQPNAMISDLKIYNRPGVTS